MSYRDAPQPVRCDVMQGSSRCLGTVGDEHTNHWFADDDQTRLEGEVERLQSELSRMKPVYEAALAWRSTPLLDKNNSSATWAGAHRDLEQACDIALKREPAPSSRARLLGENLILIKVYEAATAWRTGRDRNVIGTAPPGGQRSATGIALIDAIDQARTRFETFWQSIAKTD